MIYHSLYSNHLLLQIIQYSEKQLVHVSNQPCLSPSPRTVRLGLFCHCERQIQASMVFIVSSGCIILRVYEIK